MSHFSIRKFISPKTSQEPSAPQPQTARESKPSKSHGFMGALEGLAGRRHKVHPEPVHEQRPRVALPTMARPEPGAAFQRQQAFKLPPRREAPSMPPHREAPSMPPHREAPAMPARTAPQPTGRMHPQSTTRTQPQPTARHDAPVRTSLQSAGRTSAPHVAAPAPRRAEPAEVRHPATAPVASEAQELQGMLQELETLMAASNKKNYQLQTKVFDAETDEEEMAAQQELDEFKKGRTELIATRNAVQARVKFIAAPLANDMVQTLMQLSQFSVPQPRGGSMRDAIRSNVDTLRQHGGLLGKRDELLATQQDLRKSLERGTFNGLPPAELRQIRDLAGLDIGAKLGEVSELKTIVDRTEKRLAAMGGGGLFNGIATTAAERQRAQEQELRAAQDALDNGYR